MRIFLVIAGSVAILLVSFFATLYLMDYIAPLCPLGEAVALKAPFPKFGTGVAYSAEAATLESLSDTGTSPTRSNYLVCENGYALGPPHSRHAEIVAKGKGRFSHWNNIGFVFSASDNSDPNTNGRSYWVVSPKKGAHFGPALFRFARERQSGVPKDQGSAFVT
jgi:hypothetical protein